jgi:TatD DNase family protein
MDAYEPLGEHAWIEMETMARSSRRVVCISEIGLDFLPTSPNHDIQIQVFREQIRLARNVKLPIVIHSRESYLEVLQILREEKAGQVGGAMHYFQGDETIAWMAIELGFYISLARPLLRLPELQEVAKAIPMKHIVLETDAAPQPFKKYRHNWTEPRHVLDVARCLAVLKGITLDEVAEATTGNLAQLLGMERLARPGCH